MVGALIEAEDADDRVTVNLRPPHVADARLCVTGERRHVGGVPLPGGDDLHGQADHAGVKDPVRRRPGVLPGDRQVRHEERARERRPGRQPHQRRLDHRHPARCRLLQHGAQRVAAEPGGRGRPGTWLAVAQQSRQSAGRGLGIAARLGADQEAVVCGQARQHARRSAAVGGHGLADTRTDVLGQGRQNSRRGTGMPGGLKPDLPLLVPGQAFHGAGPGNLPAGNFAVSQGPGHLLAHLPALVLGEQAQGVSRAARIGRHRAAHLPLAIACQPGKHAAGGGGVTGYPLADLPAVI
jgi:hypothetical protein